MFKSKNNEMSIRYLFATSLKMIINYVINVYCVTLTLTKLKSIKVGFILYYVCKSLSLNKQVKNNKANTCYCFLRDVLLR